MISTRKVFLIPTVTLLIASCGGGSSDSGAGLEAGKVIQGKYVGTQSIDSVENGVIEFEPQSRELEIEVSGNTLTVLEEDFQVSTTIAADGSFSLNSGTQTVVLPLDENTDVTCTGVVEYLGQFEGTTVSGTSSAELECGPLLGQDSISVSAQGSFNLTSTG
ncbi:MAG: hypothetical protein HKN50_11425 [Gammaproteobacteria bacterium]|nr:hypothetical protein [Gammaproteobacteria bacterium]